MGMSSVCAFKEVRERLRLSALRPTRQRAALAWLLLAKGNRHVTADELFSEATEANLSISLATVYNTLHSFAKVGLVREIAIGGSKVHFDTNLSDHHHYFYEDSSELVDIPEAGPRLQSIVELPEGMDAVRVDIIVHLRPKKTHQP